MYYAYINSENICVSVWQLPEAASSSYIPITEEQYTSQSVVGMRWNATTSTWEEVIEYYYAIVDENDVCINLAHPDAEVIDDTYIAITEEQYTNQTLIGWWYNRETQTWLEEAPFAATAAHSTDEINVGTSNECLTTRLNNTYTKTEVNSLISNASGGTGTGTPGADGEDGGYYTPAVAENGDLSWTASKEGMPAVATVNIKGADGAPGAQGIQGIQGIQGEPGADGQDGAPGINGVTFTPSVAEDGTLSWTNDGGLANPAPVNIKGEKGDAGDAAAIDAYTKTQVDDLLNGKAASTHTHTEYATTDALAGKADSTHSHDYAPSTHTHTTGDLTDLASALSEKADVSHSHSEYASSSHTHSGYASSTHTHSGYASSSHTHSGYLSTSGGTVSGNLTVSGVFYVGGKQAVYNSGSQMILGTGNLATTIACASSSDVTVNGARMQIPSLLPRNGGSFQIGNTSYRFTGIYLTNSPNVSSDARCKENVAAVNITDVLDFVNKLSVCTYKYKDDPTARIGLVAQDVIAADEALANYYVDHDAETDLYSIRPADLVFPLIAAVQALSVRVAELEK